MLVADINTLESLHCTLHSDVRVSKNTRVGKICDFRSKLNFISETVWDRPMVTLNHLTLEWHWKVGRGAYFFLAHLRTYARVIWPRMTRYGMVTRGGSVSLGGKPRPIRGDGPKRHKLEKQTSCAVSKYASHPRFWMCLNNLVKNLPILMRAVAALPGVHEHKHRDAKPLFDHLIVDEIVK